MEKVDFLIVGQGIAGTLLAMELLEAGYSVQIFNEEKPNISSMKAGGLYNPITGRKMVKTWLADALFSVLEGHYQALEHKFSARFIYPMPIYRLFFSYEEQNDWVAKADEPGFVPYIQEVRNKPLGIEGLQDEFGGLMLKKSGYVNLPDMILAARKYFHHRGIYQSEVFQYENMVISSGGVEYRGFRANKIFHCEGPEAVSNPYWDYLPFSLVKGETLELDTEFPKDLIINRGVFMLPKNGHHTVGSTYDHKNLDYKPTADGIKNLKDRLHKIYDGAYETVSTSAGVRPATFDRRPFIGFHPEHPELGIFNGFGTKGVSLVPYFAGQLVNYLRQGDGLMAQVDVSRVTK